uniref:B-block binding subunit of TFIIIC domain-containing protein n=1 Tax=Romanomermis culicivorax TaxID=13658 RepID=A0A915K522_ROMCU
MPVNPAGVTLSSLWIRLKQRPNFSVNLDCHTKNYVWKFVRQYKNFKFYVLPVERPTVFEATSTIDYQDIYPVNIIKTEDNKSDRVWGSCADFFTRIDVTEIIHCDPLHANLEYVIEKYGETLVIVASDILRIKALIGPSLSVDEFLKNMTNNMHYAVLERIGRSRQFGECSLNRKPLFQAFGVRAKDIIYVFTILMRQNLINKSTLVITKDVGTSGVSGTVTTLTRFYQAPKKTSNQRMLCDLLRFLWHQPEKTAFVPVAKEALGVPKFKRIVCYYNNVIDVVWREVESDKYNEMIARCQKKLQELKRFKQEVLTSEDELSADEDDKIDVTQDSIDLEEHMTQFCLEERNDRPKRSKIIRRLAYKINDNVIYDEMKNDFKMLDEEAEEKEDQHDVDYSKRNLFRGIAYQFSSYVQAGGEDGTTCRELADCLGFSVKKSARVLDHLKMTKAVKSVVISDKRTRHQRFLWRTFEHNINDEYDIFEKQSGLNRMVLKQPNAFTNRISSNTLKRINFVLKILDDRKISHQSDLLCLVRECEKDSTTAMCCKTMALTLKVLAEISAIRVFDVEIHAGEYGSKKIKLICHRLINSIDHPLLQLFIQTARKSYAKKRSSLGLFASITSKNEEERHESCLKQPKIEYLIRDDETKTISARAQSNQKIKKRRLSTDEDRENMELMHKKKKTDNEKKEKRKKTSEQIDESIERAMIAAGQQSSSFRRKQIKQENEKLIDEVNRIMVYRKHAANFYGLQGNAVRKLVENSLVKPVDSDVQPPVYVDEIGWRRYVPPVPEAYGLPKGWFLFNSLVESIPLSLVVMTCAGPYLIKGLEEYLKDPIKRHYLLGQLPPVLAMALKRDRRISFSLNRLCESLCVMGYRSVAWKINCSELAKWYLDNLQQKSVLYESIIVQGVHNLCAHWNAFSYTLVPIRYISAKTMKPPRVQSKQVESQSDIKKAIRRLTFSPKEKRIECRNKSAKHLVRLSVKETGYDAKLYNDLVQLSTQLRQRRYRQGSGGGSRNMGGAGGGGGFSASFNGPNNNFGQQGGGYRNPSGGVGGNQGQKSHTDWWEN